MDESENGVEPSPYSPKLSGQRTPSDAVPHPIAASEDSTDQLGLFDRGINRSTESASPAYCKILLFGQLLSFLLACSGASQATLHMDCHLSAPTFSSGIIYLILSLHLIPLYYRGHRIRREVQSLDGITRNEHDEGYKSCTRTYYWFCGAIPIRVHPLAYLGIALLDVEANYFTVLAFRYTTLTSVTLFDALAIPSALILSFLFLKRRYTTIHLLGVAVCLAGVVFNVFADYESDVHNKLDSDGEREYPYKVWGDILAILGGICYGANDVLAETSVRNFGGPTEYLGMMGSFAFVISILQTALLERANVSALFRGTDNNTSVCSTGKGLGLLIAYASTGALSYVGASRFLLLSEATFLNLSFLTGDLWSVVFSIVGERIVPSPLFWVALSMTVSGVCTYEIGPSPVLGQQLGYTRAGTGAQEMTQFDESTMTDDIPSDLILRREKCQSPFKESHDESADNGYADPVDSLRTRMSGRVP